MAFIAIEEVARFLAAKNFIDLQPTALYYLYPVKAASVAALLYFYRREYLELDWSHLSRDRTWLGVCLTGLLTFVLWIFMDWTVTVAGGPGGFNVNLLPEGGIRVAMTLFRVAGAVLVVPVMEELFWRSFLLRYMIDNNFQSVPLGRFTWGSFVISSLLFGLEHHLFLAGVGAGVIFSLVLYRTKSLSHCILAHGVTNLALAIYVLVTGEWQLW